MLARVICVLAVGSSSALQIGAPQGRRAFLSQLAAAGTLAASPMAAPPSPPGQAFPRPSRESMMIRTTPAACAALRHV